jgi:vitamin B12/bleomycin/antimicrobial peptide transport system ATP-binding/permease protein
MVSGVYMDVFDRRIWIRFWQIARMYWFSDEKWRARGVLALLILLLLVFTGLGVAISYANRNFFNALSERDSQEFTNALLMFLGVLIVATPVSALFDWVRKLLGVNWRLWLTGYYLRRYFSDRAYYHINNDKEIDNPDQRISQDIASFTSTSLDFLALIVASLIQLVAFIGILLSISKILVAILVAYAAFGTAVTTLFGKRLVSLNFLQLRKDADFRYGLVHIRNNAESIAFYRGEGREEHQVKERLQEAISNSLRLVGWERNLAFFQKGYEYVILVLPYAIMAPLYFSGEVKLGIVMQAADAFIQVLSALKIVVAQFQQISQFAAGVSRLESFDEAVERDGTRTGVAAHVIACHEEHCLSLKQVTLMTPNYEQTLLRQATAEVPSGGGLLIMGPSGAGKSSVLRAIAGLWNAGEGEILRPPLAETIFLPQRPYMVLGSLRDQLLYPMLNQETSDEELRKALETVNLANLPERVGGFDAVLGWGQLLSLGEQQRLAFARLLLTQPRYAFLDEATSALDVTNEALLYRHLRQAGATFVSVGHRPSLVEYHDQVLELQGGGGWRLASVREFKAVASA